MTDNTQSLLDKALESMRNLSGVPLRSCLHSATNPCFSCKVVHVRDCENESLNIMYNAAGFRDKVPDLPWLKQLEVDFYRTVESNGIGAVK